jgi:uncharacterized protein with LGFP repeats
VTRLATRLFVVLGLVAAVVVAPAVSSTPSAPAQAADLRYFDPGNIISDAIFFDGLGMDAAAIQAFLNTKGASCNWGTDGSACLKNYRMTTTDRAADALCSSYRGAVNESAATIIAKVGAACRVNPRVLLVLLQKEMGLVTTTNPTAKKYERAAGYACPDSANGGCDPAYAGLQNQLYRSAWQYQRYAAYSANYSYKAGRNNQIPWHPNTGCGYSTVYIANQATAGLYNYTPYRPNQAALNAGYSTGDSCSSYGNRNFWQYFTDWFGNTQSVGGDAILTSYTARGGATGPLGAQTTGIICGLAQGGCGQIFQNGRLYWSPSTGVRAVSEPVMTTWAQQRVEAGPLGYPIGELACGLKDGACGQVFQGGRIYSSPTGTHAILEPMQQEWLDQGWEYGPLGYPVTGTVCGLKNGGCGQVFQGGRIYSSPTTGTHAILEPVNAEWLEQGWENGPMGYPITGLACGLKDGGCGQVFQGGRIYSTPTTGTRAILEPLNTAWLDQGWEYGPLGYPSGDQVCGLAGGGCKQSFQGGSLYSHPTAGTHPMTGAIAATWTATGAEDGRLGYPIMATVCGLKDGGCGQVFQTGRVYTGPGTGTHAISGPILTSWLERGWEKGPMGYPTGAQVCGLAGGGCKQSFQGGTLYSHPTAGTHPVSGALGTTWAATGAESGPLGYPIMAPVCGLKDGGCGQVFQTGRVYSTAGTGTHAISGTILAAWLDRGWEKGPLGYPTGAQVCGLAGGGCKQPFQGGTLYTHPAAGTHPMTGVIATAWTATGAESGPLGYPIMGVACGLRDGGCGQVFQTGRIYTTAGTGTHAITGPILDAWLARGWETGPMGYPTSAAYAVTGGTAQDFQGGTLTLDSGTGQVTRN